MIVSVILFNKENDDATSEETSVGQCGKFLQVSSPGFEILEIGKNRNSTF